MSHKTLIAGTSYEVKAGNTLNGGTKFQMGGVKPSSAVQPTTSRFPKASR